MALYGACAKVKDTGMKDYIMSRILDTFLDLSWSQTPKILFINWYYFKYEIPSLVLNLPRSIQKFNQPSRLLRLQSCRSRQSSQSFLQRPSGTHQNLLLSISPPLLRTLNSKVLELCTQVVGSNQQSNFPIDFLSRRWSYYLQRYQCKEFDLTIFRGTGPGWADNTLGD